jgi:hypothetical protein
LRDLRRPYPRRQALVGRGVNKPHCAHTFTEEPKIVLNCFYTPSLATVRTLLVALSLVAMALAGSAGSNWS